MILLFAASAEWSLFRCLDMEIGHSPAARSKNFSFFGAPGNLASRVFNRPHDADCRSSPLEQASQRISLISTENTVGGPNLRATASWDLSDLRRAYSILVAPARVTSRKGGEQPFAAEPANIRFGWICCIFHPVSVPSDPMPKQKPTPFRRRGQAFASIAAAADWIASSVTARSSSVRARLGYVLPGDLKIPWCRNASFQSFARPASAACTAL
ncbi:hypothetical protein FIU89_04710 [Roseovarius sp. THAF27]|nr:hypothetical protein FIU89_04710 [Roseovarius sp. THAF27]